MCQVSARRTMISRRSAAKHTIAQEVTVMLSHPDSFIDLALIRHQELQAECARYRLSTQAAPTRRAGSRHSGTRARFSAIADRLRPWFRDLTDPEKLLEAFARMNYPNPM